jgi:hypothetical protein
MHRRQFLNTVATASLLSGAAAQTTAPGRVPLFDGKSLSGWTIEEGPETAFYIDSGDIVVHESGNYPTWLRSNREYENFDLRGEFFVKGWTDSGIYIHAPLYGRPTWEGIQIKIFQDREDQPKPNSMGSLFPLIAPSKINVRNQGEWNSIRIRMDWPRLQLWTNDEMVQDVNLDAHPDFRVRRRRGYLGLASLSYPIRFRNFTIEELPGKEEWQVLYQSPSDMDKWFVSEGKPRFQAIGDVLWSDGQGHLATKQKFRDFELRMYIRAARFHNGGVLFRTTGHGLGGQHYEIQLHNVEDAHYPTGSLYHYKRSTYPRIEPESWFPFQLIAKGKECMVRITAIRCSSTISSKCWTKAPSSCRRTAPGIGPNTRIFGSSRCNRRQLTCRPTGASFPRPRCEDSPAFHEFARSPERRARPSTQSNSAFRNKRDSSDCRRRSSTQPSG